MSLSLSAAASRSTEPPPPSAPPVSAGGTGTTGNKDNNHDAVDFIAAGQAVKQLFALPYATSQSISIAVHNLEGTLLIDQDVEEGNNSKTTTTTNGTTTGLMTANRAPRLSDGQNNKKDEGEKKSINLQEKKGDEERSLVPLSSIEYEKSGALALLKSFMATTSPTEVSALPLSPPTNHEKTTTANHTAMIPTKTTATPAAVDAPHSVVVEASSSSWANNNNENREENTLLELPPPEDYVQAHIPRPVDPVEYFNFQCRQFSLLVGSDALVYQNVAIRMENRADLHRAICAHEEAVRRGHFQPDHSHALLQQQGKPTYAQATAVTQRQIHVSSLSKPTSLSSSTTSTTDGFAAPDLDKVRLQSCIVPSTSVGGLLNDAPVTATTPIDQTRQAISPVSIVVDAYLDNIVANVPQLALCLQEKGLIQSVKLMETPDIPQTFLRPSTLDTSRPIEVLTPDETTERVFSPQIMEMNASALLNFLKTNCTRNNTTYLLRREAGQTNIQLYDISSISAQKQRKWIWWLAMMSYRFANRLRDVALRTGHLARVCRNRQRSLLENTLELLEVLTDLDDNRRESLVAAIREQLADTYLWEETHGPNDRNSPPSTAGTSLPTTFAQRQPYQMVSVDGLEKAQSHLEKGIKILWPVMQENLNRQKTRKEREKHKRGSSSRINVTTEEEEGSSDSDEEEERQGHPFDENEAVATQLYGMHQKIVNLYLRLAEIHLTNYFSSSAMQCLRSAARRLADSLFLIGETLRSTKSDPRTSLWLHRSQLQYVWLWEHCGFFARSFGADSLWRDRGHARADDILSVMRDAEAAFKERESLTLLQQSHEKYKFLGEDALSKEIDREVNLYFLSGVVSSPPKTSITVGGSTHNPASVEAAREYLSDQHTLRREERQVFVASCLAYQRAVFAFQDLVEKSDKNVTSSLMELLQQRFGDACNEVGKILLSAIRGASTSHKVAVEALLSSSYFWFSKGLQSFQQCGDLKNLVALRCNLSQYYKLHANDFFAKNTDASFAHAEKCLEEAVTTLLASHEALGMRETDTVSWDMVSAELAATYLLLGVKRREALIGRGNIPLILKQLRLSPGKERSIVEPMQKALDVYERMGNAHQVAATHYQLAQYFSKVWTCQHDENKTREKLAAAFVHYKSAHGYFVQSPRGNEITLCTLCLELSNFYASIQGQGMVSKEALLCCFDSIVTFSPDSVQAHSLDNQWLAKMASLAAQVEEVIFKVLRDLTKLDEGKALPHSEFKTLYRVGLTAKMTMSAGVTVGQNKDEKDIQRCYTVLEAVRQSWHEIKQ